MPEKPWPADLPFQEDDVVLTRPLADAQIMVPKPNRRFAEKGAVVGFSDPGGKLIFSVRHDQDESIGYYEARELSLLRRPPAFRRLRVRGRGKDLVVQEEGEPGTWTTVFAGPLDCSFFEVTIPATDPLRFGTWAAIDAAAGKEA